MDELQFFPLVFNFDICGFDIYGTLVAQINRTYRFLSVLLKRRTQTEPQLALVTVAI
jgi:hypothetical protein